MDKKICGKCGSDMKRGVYQKEGDRLDGKNGWKCINPKCKRFVFDNLSPVQEL